MAVSLFTENSTVSSQQRIFIVFTSSTKCLKIKADQQLHNKKPKVWAKSKFLAKIKMFGKKSKFSAKIEIVGMNGIFVQKWKFCAQIEILAKKSNLKFWAKIELLGKNQN